MRLGPDTTSEYYAGAFAVVLSDFSGALLAVSLAPLLVVSVALLSELEVALFSPLSAAGLPVAALFALFLLSVTYQPLPLKWIAGELSRRCTRVL